MLGQRLGVGESGGGGRHGWSEYQGCGRSDQEVRGILWGACGVQQGAAWTFRWDESRGTVISWAVMSPFAESPLWCWVGLRGQEGAKRPECGWCRRPGDGGAVGMEWAGVQVRDRPWRRNHRARWWIRR